MTSRPMAKVRLVMSHPGRVTWYSKSRWKKEASDAARRKLFSAFAKNVAEG